MLNKKERNQQKEFYQKTQQNALAGRRDLQQPKKKNKTQASSTLWYIIPSILITVAISIGAVLFVQLIMKTFHNLGLPESEQRGFFASYGLGWIYAIWFIIVTPLIGLYAHHRCKAVWTNNNAMYLSEDIEEYTNDAYVRTMDHIVSEFDAAPDAGLGFDGNVMAVIGHGMISNKGIKKIEMPILDPDREGQIAVDENGKVKTKKVEMFDKDFAIELYNYSNVPQDFQKWYDATQYAFNEKTSKKERKHGNARKGAFGRKAYDLLSDYINGEFYPLESDTQRPAGVYFYDSRPVNTILIAITRGGKGQTCATCSVMKSYSAA